MRKLLTLILSAGIISMSFAQQIDVAVKDNFKSSKKGVIPASSKAVIWEDDFSTPANWVMAAAAGTDNWVIGTTGPSGSYAIDPIVSTSGGNFALFDSDLLCSGNQVANLTNATAINCTGHSSVALQFEEMYRKWYDSTFVFVSTNGTTWTKFIVAPNNTYANNGMTTNPTQVTINISSAIAANPATVWVRFQFYSPSSMGASAGCGYSWMVDDVKLVDVNDHDMVLTKTLVDMGLGFNMVTPVSQMGQVYFSAIVTNAGNLAQTNVGADVSFNGGTYTGTEIAPFATMAPAASDTLDVIVDFTNPNAETYVGNVTVTQNETDQIPANNVSGDIEFYTANYEFYRDLNIAGILGQFSFGTQVTAESGVTAFGSNYMFLQNDRIDSVYILVYSSTANTSVKGKVYTWDLATTRTLVGETALTPVGALTQPTVISIPLTTPYNVDASAGYQAITVMAELTWGATTDTIYICTGNDPMISAGQGGALYIKLASTGAYGWYVLTSGYPLVGLGVQYSTENRPVAISGNTVAFPNPATDVVFVAENSNVEIVNMLGQTVATYTNVSKVDVSALNAGTYFFKVMKDGVPSVQKINIVK